MLKYNMRQRIGIHRFPPQSKTQEEHMKTRKLTAVLLALIMAFAVLPAAAFAESIEGIAGEAAAMRKLDNAWAALDAA
jgi:hypothetical protein